MRVSINTAQLERAQLAAKQGATKNGDGDAICIQVRNAHKRRYGYRAPYIEFKELDIQVEHELEARA